MIPLRTTISARIIIKPFNNRHETHDKLLFKCRCPIHGCCMDHLDSGMAICPQCPKNENEWYMGGGRARQFTAEVKRGGEQIFGEGGRMV